MQVSGGEFGYLWDAQGNAVYRYDGSAWLCYLNDDLTGRPLMVYGSASGETFPVKAVTDWGANGLLAQTTVTSNADAGTNYYAFDPEGSTADLVNGSGQLVSEFYFDTYGYNRNPGVDAPVTDDHTGPFAQWGAESAPSTQLVQMGHRVYDPYTGRWLTRDPIGYAGGINLYEYAEDQPDVISDPSGLDPDDDDTDIPDSQIGMLGDEYAAPFTGPGGAANVQGLLSANPITEAGYQAYNAATGCNAATGQSLGVWGRLGAAAAAIGTLATLDVGGAGEGLPEGVAPKQTVTVSRWGRPGLEPGDWVMLGKPNLWNYIKSFKWQPGAGNEFAPFRSGQGYEIFPDQISWPSGWGIEGWWKGLFGQRRFLP
jgi:RHS repeat-associated protein